MGTKTKVKSKTVNMTEKQKVKVMLLGNKVKKSTTKKPIKKLTSRQMDRRSIFQKCNKFASNLMSGVNLIFQQHEDLQKYVLWNMFWDCIYTTHSNSFISKHIEEMEKDDDYRRSVKQDCSAYDDINMVRLMDDEPEGELLDYQICPMNKKRLENGMRDLIDNGGVAKFQKVLNDLDKSLIKGRY